MFGAIYKITFPNNKAYVGRTRLTSIDQLTCRYEYELKRNPRPVVSALKKYGLCNCKFEFIHKNASISEKELNQLEMNSIKEHLTMISENGYNVTKGGDGGAGFGKFNSRYVHLSEEVIDEINQLRSLGKSLSYIVRTLKLPNRDIVKRRLNLEFQNLETCEKLEHKSTWKEIDRTVLEKLLADEFSTRKIAKFFSVSNSVIRKRLDLWNLKTANM